MFQFGETMQALFMASATPPIPRFVIFSKWQDGVPAVPPFYVPVMFYDSKFRWATQRRRMAYDCEPSPDRYLDRYTNSQKVVRSKLVWIGRNC